MNVLNPWTLNVVQKTEILFKQLKKKKEKKEEVDTAVSARFDGFPE